MNKKGLWGEAVIEHPSKANASERTVGQTDIYTSFFCLAVIIFLLVARKYIYRSLMPIIRCCFRFSHTLRVEDNISLGQGRIILFIFSLFHFSMLSFYVIQEYRTDLFDEYGWFLVPFFFLAYTLFYALRWIVFGFVGWVIKRYGEFAFIARGLGDYLIFAATFTIPLTFITLLSWPSAMNLLFTWCALVLIIGYLLFLYRTLRYFIYVRFSIFFWILYLCTLEIAPIAFLYSALITI
ncbi:MAG: DUF4271 domain-containing protein [Bacteroidales bacterium]|nr:DUF4271 domain-containing protein [Bacteroidales bacterium]